MKPTDTSEKGLEDLIIRSLTEEANYEQGRQEDYDRDYSIDLIKLINFLKKTQPKIVEHLGINQDGSNRTQFLHRLQGEIAKRGVVDVLRKGIKHGPASVTIFYGIPTAGNVKAAELFSANVFSVTRQLRYSTDKVHLALDLVIFINGLPIATFELKNKLTKQTVQDAVQQYKRDRDPKDPLFQFGRCVVHFAVDDHEVQMCTHLQGPQSWFLPFNKGWDDGAGNPPNPEGLETDYLWKDVLTKTRFTEILENYAQIIEEIDKKGRKTRKQIFPRYHQLDVVRKLLAHVSEFGAGKRYLVEHSAGSGKSNSIAWLSHQLVELKKNGKPVFDSIIVVTDRIVLDDQIRVTVKEFAHVKGVVGHAEKSGDLRRFIQSGKKIIISTVQKFPFILDEIGSEHRGRTFAIIIDEAHSSQGGKVSAKMNIALSGRGGADEYETIEDQINSIMESRKMLPNSSYFAFTATPKNRTLEIFGDSYNDFGTIKRRPFHVYTMKQAIQEGFILDVLHSYTTVRSYYRLMKMVPDDPTFDIKRARKKLRRLVESNEYTIQQKAEIMLDHFHDQVITHRKIGGKARAMVVTSGIERAIHYYYAFLKSLKERNSPYKAIVAFSGEHEYGGREGITEASLNHFPSKDIPDNFKLDPYRFLIVAEKFQTGYDEPLLHTMYVDKQLSNIKAVQTLSRLNRAHPQKYDTFVLDFVNETDVIEEAFTPYYRTTILSEETDPNKLHDLKADLDSYQVYTWHQIEQLIALYLSGVDRDKLDPTLDTCVVTYRTDLDEDGQIDFKGKAKTFVRTYSFLASILPYVNAEWEKLSIFLNFLIPKLPAPQEKDLSKGILETIDLDSYRVEVKATLELVLPDSDGQIGPVPTSAGGSKYEPYLDLLSNIIKEFNDQFGNIEWSDADKIRKIVSEEIPTKVAGDKAYQNAMKYSDEQNARIEHDKVLQRVMTQLFADQTELFKLFSDNPSFRKWLADKSFKLTYEPSEDCLIQEST